jgi:hypothetical protein
MKRSRFAAPILALLLVCSSQYTNAQVAQPEVKSEVASKAPAVIFIMRHAEKPIAEDKSSDLAPQGFKRASVLPTLFVAAPGSSAPARLPRPDVIFATAVSKHSNRPIETVTPLAQALRLRIKNDFEDRETGPLAHEVLSGKYAGKVVLICWHHGEIPHVAEALGVTDAPKKWDDTVFDQIWRVEFVGGKAQMTIVHEELLPGDSK